MSSAPGDDVPALGPLKRLLAAQSSDARPPTLAPTAKRSRASASASGSATPSLASGLLQHGIILKYAHAAKFTLGKKAKTWELRSQAVRCRQKGDIILIFHSAKVDGSRVWCAVARAKWDFCKAINDVAELNDNFDNTRTTITEISERLGRGRTLTESSPFIFKCSSSDRPRKSQRSCKNLNSTFLCVSVWCRPLTLGPWRWCWTLLLLGAPRCQQVMSKFDCSLPAEQCLNQLSARRWLRLLALGVHGQEHQQ